MKFDNLEDYFRINRINELRHYAFRDARKFNSYCFENDNGKVPKLEHGRKYAEKWDEMRSDNIGMLFWGPPGSGKTFAAASIANALCEKFVSVRMMTLGTILTLLPVKTFHEREVFLQDICYCDLLILDDFGMERQTDYANEQVFSIIDGRYLARKPLIVTTNLSLDELKHPTNITKQRVYDRILEMCVPVKFDGESLRREKAAEKRKLYLEITGK